jgi:hypothetical protein
MAPDYSAPANPLKLVALNDLMAKPAPAAAIRLVATTSTPSVPARYNNVVQRPSSGNDVQPYIPHLPASVLRAQPTYSSDSEPQELQPVHPASGYGAGDM